MLLKHSKAVVGLEWFSSTFPNESSLSLKWFSSTFLDGSFYLSSVLLSAGTSRDCSVAMASKSNRTCKFISVPSWLPVSLYVCLLVSVRIHQRCVGLLVKSQSQFDLPKTLPASPLHPLPPSPWTIDSFQYEKCSWFSAIPQWLNLLPNLDCPYSRMVPLLLSTSKTLRTI